MTKKIATAEEVRKKFTVGNIEEAISRIGEEMQKLLTYERCEDILGCCADIITVESTANFSPYDKMCLIARQAYLLGYLESSSTHFEAAERAYKELFSV